MSADALFKIKLSRTLWFNTYRAKVTDIANDYVASLRIIPAMALDRSEVPPDAPEVTSYIIVIVEDAVGFSVDTIVEFETNIAELLLAELTRYDLKAETCQFFYPSPLEMLAAPNGSSH